MAEHPMNDETGAPASAAPVPERAQAAPTSVTPDDGSTGDVLPDAAAAEITSAMVASRPSPRRDRAPIARTRP